MSVKSSYEGIFSALPTPMDQSGAIDLEGLFALMEWQLSPTPVCQSGDVTSRPSDRERQGVNGFVLYGTTGEASTLSLEEKELITIQAAERYPEQTLIAGIGTNTTAGSAKLAQQASEWGADAGLLVTPYYNRPSQEGLYRHVLSVADSVPDWPIVLYIVPSRAAVTIEIETVDRILNACPQVVAIKDASADLAYGVELVQCCADRAVVLSGDDPTALASWAVGTRGSISVMSNLFPAEMSHLWRLFNQGELSAAQALFHKIHPLIQALFVETNPVPLKRALSYLAQLKRLPISAPCLSPSVRLPLAPLCSESEAYLIDKIEQTLAHHSEGYL